MATDENDRLRVDLNDAPHRTAIALRLKMERPKNWAKVQAAVEVRGANQITGTLAALASYSAFEQEITRLEDANG